MARKPTTAEIKQAANEALRNHDGGLAIQDAAAIQRTTITRPPPISDPLEETVVESVSRNTRFIRDRSYELPPNISQLQTLIDWQSDYINRWLRRHTPSAFCAYADHKPNMDGGSYESLYLHLKPIQESTTVSIAKNTDNPDTPPPATGNHNLRTTITFLVARDEEGAYLGHLVVNRPDVNIRINGHELRKETDKVRRRVAGPLPKFCVIEVGDGGPAVFFWFLRSPDEEKSSSVESEEQHGNKKSKTKLPSTGGDTGADANVPPHPSTVEGQKSANETENAPVDAPHTEAPTESEKQPGDGPATGPETQPGNGNGNGNGPTNGPGNGTGNAPVNEQDKEQPSTLTACEEFFQRLGGWQEMSAGESPNTLSHRFGTDWERLLEDEEITYAILSVTESLAEDFARIPATAVNVIRRESEAGPFAAVLRPRNRLLLPWIDCTHTFLVVVTLNSDPTPAGRPNASIETYDSSPDYHRWHIHGGEQHLQEIRDQIVNLIGRVGWVGNAQDNQGIVLPNSVTPRGSSRQPSGSNTCGLHTIFNAWCIAMNLRINVDMALPESRMQEFYKHGLQVVNLAGQGRMDSQTIIRFFECYGFIRPAQAGAQNNNNQIARTTRMEDDEAMIAHVRFFQDPGQPPAIDDVRTALMILRIPFDYSDTIDQLRTRLEQNLNGGVAMRQRLQDQAEQQFWPPPPQTPTLPPQLYTSANPYPPNFEDWSENARRDWIREQMLARGWDYSPNSRLFDLQNLWRALLASEDDEHNETGQSQNPAADTNTSPETNTQPGVTGLGIDVHGSAEPLIGVEGQTGSANDNTAQNSTGNDIPSDDLPSDNLPSDDSASMDLSSDAPPESGEAQAPAEGGAAKKKGAPDGTNGDGNGGGPNKKQKTSHSGK